MGGFSVVRAVPNILGCEQHPWVPPTPPTPQCENQRVAGRAQCPLGAELPLLRTTVLGRVLVLAADPGVTSGRPTLQTRKLGPRSHRTKAIRSCWSEQGRGVGVGREPPGPCPQPHGALCFPLSGLCSHLPSAPLCSGTCHPAAPRSSCFDLSLGCMSCLGSSLCEYATWWGQNN